MASMRNSFALDESYALPVKQKTFQRRNFQSYSFYKSFVSGGIAGSIAKTLVAPIDRVKLIFMVILKIKKI